MVREEEEERVKTKARKSSDEGFNHGRSEKRERK